MDAPSGDPATREEMSDMQPESINPKLYGGADWLRRPLERRGKKFSIFGERVADLLGWVFAGIYHIEDAVLSDVAVWDQDDYARIALSWNGLSTYHPNYLTRLVIACHDLSVRLEINPCNFSHLELLFHPRKREGAGFHYHPTIEQAIEWARAEQ